MTEDPTQTTASEPATQPNPAMPLNARLAVFVAIILFLFMLQYTANGCARESIKMSWLGRTTSAVAAAVAPAVDEGNQVRVRRMLEEVAKDARFAAITVTDPAGKVLASTDRMMQDRVLDSMKDAPDLPRILRQDGRLVSVRTVNLGGAKVGAIRIEVAPD